VDQSCEVIIHLSERELKQNAKCLQKSLLALDILAEYRGWIKSIGNISVILK
jgi:hypothetical protein